LISGGTSGEYINGVGSLVAFPSIPAALSFSLPLSNSSGTVSINAATESAAGSMSSADKTKLDGIASGATAGITALTGDVTASGSGSQAATLATVNSSPGSFGDSTHTVTATVDAKGRITALSANAIGTLNQSTTGNALTATTAANLSGTPALPNGVTATTQSAGDNSTNLATTAYADRMLPLGGGTLTGGLTGKTGAWTGNSTFTPASAAGVAISHAAGIDSDTLRLHKMDPLTTHKNCPGRNCSVEFDTIKRDVHAYIASRNNG